MSKQFWMIRNRVLYGVKILLKKNLFEKDYYIIDKNRGYCQKRSIYNYSMMIQDEIRTLFKRMITIRIKIDVERRKYVDLSKPTGWPSKFKHYYTIKIWRKIRNVLQHNVPVGLPERIIVRIKIVIFKEDNRKMFIENFWKFVLLRFLEKFIHYEIQIRIIVRDHIHSTQKPFLAFFF